MIGWRRLTAVLMLLVCFSCFLAVPCFAAGTTEFIVRTDRDCLRPGDTVTCTVSVGAVEDLYGMKLKVNIPEGLTLVKGSGSTGKDLTEVLGAAKTEFVESTGVFLAGACQYSAAEETVLFQFQCVVDENPPESMEIFLEIDPENVFDSQYQNISFTVTSATIRLDDTCVHVWSEASADEENGHWFDCQLCDMSRIDDHMDSDEDGLCDVCGYGTPAKKGNFVVWVIVGLLAAAGVAVTAWLMTKRKTNRP